MIQQRSLVVENIEHAIEPFEQSLDSTYSVAWIDCLQAGSNWVDHYDAGGTC